MAEITRLFFWRHLRAESSSHIIQYRAGRRVRSGRGLSFWFLPLSASLSEVPVDDRELVVLFHGRSQDFQDVATQAVVTWRVEDPERLAQRVDFSIDPSTGAWTEQPIEKVGQLLSGLSQQVAWDYVARTPLEVVLVEGVDAIRGRIGAGLVADPELEDMGIKVVSVRISAISPTSEVEKALQTPTRESIQQEADKATYERRALAVERERAIAENELQNQIELARREEELIGQRGQNEQRRMTEEAEAQRIRVEAAAARVRVESASEAEATRVVEAARADAERDRIGIYRELPTELLLALAAREVAGNLPDIEHLSLGPDALGPLLERLVRVGANRLEQEA